MSAQSKLEAEIGGLVDLSRSELVTRWHRIYRCPPPKGVKRALLERAIAWHVQARHFGGLSPVIKRRLREVAGGGSTDRLARTNSQTTGARSRFSISPSSLAPGTRLIRQWHGRNHCVDVIEEGFVFEGKTYLSLSAIAREITCARWSGPRFFGL
ncbi:MAG: DUF2924 domain-containing protein [Pseudomonadota bacterium]